MHPEIDLPQWSMPARFTAVSSGEAERLDQVQRHISPPHSRAMFPCWADLRADQAT
jgi:hypothetical protein